MRLTLSCLLLVAACGGKSPEPTTPANTASAKPADPISAPAVDKTVCGSRPDEYGPYVLTAQQAATRYGTGAAKFSDAPTTKDKAIEVCGIPAQQAWLMMTGCADGSKAYTSPRQVAESRSGNVGEGGRCGAIIDLYLAKCPEKEYEVHVDMYMCGPGEQF